MNRFAQKIIVLSLLLVSTFGNNVFANSSASIISHSSLISSEETVTKVAIKPVEPFYTNKIPIGDRIYQPEITYLSPIKKAPLTFSSLAVTWNQNTPAKTSIKIQVRLQKNKVFAPWNTLNTEIDTKAGQVPSNFKTAFLTSAPANGYQYRITLKTNDSHQTPTLQGLKFTFINGGSMEQQTGLALNDFKYNKKTATPFETNEYMPRNIQTSSQSLSAKTGDSANITSTALVAQAEMPLNTGTVNRFHTSQTVKTAQNNNPLKIISRAQWGADESLRVYNPATAVPPQLVTLDPNFATKFANELKISKTITTNSKGQLLTWPESYPEKVTKIIIHHTATTANLDNPKQAIRDIYYWHTMVKGWGDIGYNYIIDQQGNIYEGRAGGEGVIGAHAGEGNNGSIGIAVLGNYQNQDPPEAVVTALVKLIKVKAKLHGINTEGFSEFRGKNLPNIMGHRDIMATECPGDHLYALLPLIREMSKADNNSNTKQKDIDPSLNFQFANSTPAFIFSPHGRKTLNMTIKNTGTVAWNKNTYFQIAPNQNAKTFFKNGAFILSSAVGKTINPGDKAQIKINIRASKISGSGLVALEPILNGKTLIKKYLSFGVKINDPPAKPKYDYQLAGIYFSNYDYKPGDLITVTIKLKNLGSEIWSKTGPHRVTLGADKPRDHLDILLPTPSPRLADLQENQVKYNQMGTFVFKVRVPKRNGIYKEFFTPVVEGITWMQNHNSFLKFNIGNSVQLTHNTNPTPTPTPTTSNIVALNATSTTFTKSNKSTKSINIAPHKLDINKHPAPIRIDLTYRGNPVTISANGKFLLFQGQNKIHSFAVNTLIKITSKNHLFIISAPNYYLTITGNPRFVPDNSSVIMRIDNWTRMNSTNTINYNQFRGALEILNYKNQLHVINDINIEDYLRGIAEESSSEPVEKIKAIMVIARTYARFYSEIATKFAGAPFDLKDDPITSQKYLGYNFEKHSPITANLATATKGIYVTYLGRLIKTPFFSRSNGRTISAYDKWGWTDAPFLQSVNDSFCGSTVFSGHGVGLSGCGATALAKLGKTYQEIIKHYYTGVALTKINTN